MKHFVPIDLSEPSNEIVIGSGDLTEDRREWAQPTERWGVIYYMHRNLVMVNAVTTSVAPNTLVFFPPGSRGAHQRVEENATFVYFASFVTPGRSSNRVALPLVVEDAARFLPDFVRAAERVSTTLQPAIAFLWNLCWAVAKDPIHLRTVGQLYDAEAFILSHLGEDFRIRDVADACGLSQRQLLRAFREQHGMTIQEYVRRKRIQEAVRFLTTTDEPMKAVARRVGVRDSQQFNKLIRGGTGRSPSLLRELARKD